MDSPAPVTFRTTLYQPLLAPLAARRDWVLGLAAAGSLQVGLTLAGLPGWICPFRAVTGLPCPGCRLTEALRLLLHGRVWEAVHAHAYAPIFLLAFLLVFGVALLPAGRRRPALARLEAFERRTGLAGWVLLSLMLYWVIRLAGLA